jgi:hypothetical protein
MTCVILNQEVPVFVVPAQSSFQLSPLTRPTTVTLASAGRSARRVADEVARLRRLAPSQAVHLE